MPLELGVWRIDGSRVEITPSGLSDERRLEDILGSSGDTILSSGDTILILPRREWDWG